MNTNDGSIPHAMKSAIRHGRVRSPSGPPSAKRIGTPAMAARQPAFARKIRTAVSTVISSASRVSDAPSAP